MGDFLERIQDKEHELLIHGIQELGITISPSIEIYRATRFSAKYTLFVSESALDYKYLEDWHRMSTKRGYPFEFFKPIWGGEVDETHYYVLTKYVEAVDVTDDLMLKIWAESDYEPAKYFQQVIALFNSLQEAYLLYQSQWSTHPGWETHKQVYVVFGDAPDKYQFKFGPSKHADTVPYANNLHAFLLQAAKCQPPMINQKAELKILTYLRQDVPEMHLARQMANHPSQYYDPIAKKEWFQLNMQMVLAEREREGRVRGRPDLGERISADIVRMMHLQTGKLPDLKWAQKLETLKEPYVTMKKLSKGTEDMFAYCKLLRNGSAHKSMKIVEPGNWTYLLDSLYPNLCSYLFMAIVNQKLTVVGPGKKTERDGVLQNMITPTPTLEGP